MKVLFLRLQPYIALLYDAIMGKEKEFTSGSINRSIILLAIPMVLELVMESIFVCASLFFVSRLGASAISIVGATESVITFSHSVAIGLSIAASTLIARRVGEKKYKLAGLTAVQVIWLAVILGMLISMICYIWSDKILILVGLSKSMVQQGASYIKVMFACCGFIIIRIALNGILRGAGFASIAMRTLWLSNTLNILLCPLFIFGWSFIPSYGLLGVGMATGISRFAGVCYQIWYLVSENEILSISKQQLILHYGILKKIINLGAGGMFQYLIPASSWLLMIKIVSYFGDNALAGYIIAQRVTSIMTMPAWGIGNAAGILTGQNLGAKKPKRAEKSVWKAGVMNMIFLILVAVAWIFMAEPVVAIFSEKPEVSEHGINYIHIISIAYILLGYTMVISRALNAAGKIITVTLLYILMFYIIQIPLSYILGVIFNLGPKGIFTAILISEIVLASACIYVFKKGEWKFKKV